MKPQIMKLTGFFLPILCPILLLGQGSEGISKRNLADADLNLIGNHDPAVEKENFDLLPGYEVNLFAQEPMLANPIHMTWDLSLIHISDPRDRSLSRMPSSA